jgi:8-oxo-dGTP pyrophosphatase MutT (NUDIX family)
VARTGLVLVARVLVVRDGAAGGPELLAARHRDDAGGEFWCLPGGKVEAGERFDLAARRELREEAGIDAELGGVVWVQELVERIRLELVFSATVPPGPLPDHADPGDRHLVGIAWRSLAELAATDFRPAGLLAALRRGELASVPYVAG